MVRVHAYFKKGSNKSDYKGHGTISGVTNTIKSLMKEPDISVIVIENPSNNHRFKWDPSMDQRWREIGKPQDPQTIKAIDQMRREFHANVNKSPQVFKTPIISKNVVIKIGGQVVAMAKADSFTVNHAKEIKIK